MMNPFKTRLPSLSGSTRDCASVAPSDATNPEGAATGHYGDAVSAAGINARVLA